MTALDIKTNYVGVLLKLVGIREAATSGMEALRGRMRSRAQHRSWKPRVSLTSRGTSLTAPVSDTKLAVKSTAVFIVALRFLGS
jgi:hypothetical protein